MADIHIENHESELALLAHILRHPMEYPVLADIVKKDDFSWRAFGWVWEAMGKISAAGMTIDTIMVGDELDRAGRLQEFCFPGPKQFTGRAALSGIRELQTTKGGGESYALSVQDYARKRDIFNLSSKIAEWSINGRTSAAIISDVETELSQMVLHSGKIVTHTMRMELAVARAMDATEKAAHGGDNGLKTGLIDLDKRLGIQKAELITIAARPGQGKTALLCTIMLNAARAGKACLFFSVEMSGVSITQRLLSQLSGISGFRIMEGKIHDDEMIAYIQATETLAGLPIIICDLPAIHIGQIRTEARKHEVDFIALDYIQLANADTKNDRRDLDIGEVTRGLKALAKERDIPVLAAAQLNRQSEGRADRKPTLGDLRESGSIENDSDSVVFIHRPDQYGNKESRRDAELIIGKHRNGPVGVVNTLFMEETMNFVSADTRHVDLNERKDLE